MTNVMAPHIAMGIKESLAEDIPENVRTFLHYSIQYLINWGGCIHITARFTVSRGTATAR